MMFRRVCFRTLGVALKVAAVPFWLASAVIGCVGRLVSRRGYEVGSGAMRRFFHKMTSRPQKGPGVVAVRGVPCGELKIFLVRPY